MRGGPFLALYFGLLIIACFFAFGAKSEHRTWAEFIRIPI